MAPSMFLMVNTMLDVVLFLKPSQLVALPSPAITATSYCAF